MRHQDYKELLHLTLLQELSDDERQMLDKHLNECTECRSEFGELKHMSELVARHGMLDVTDDLLSEARRELRVALRLEQARKSRWVELFDRLNILSFPQVRVAFAGVAMLVLGLGLGYLLFVPSAPLTQIGLPTSSQAISSQSGETRVSNLRFINQSTEEGDVEFSFEMVTPVRMKGSVKDHAVQRVLAQALLDDRNPGARLQTVSTLAAQVVPSMLPDKEIKESLIRALKSDANVGVRREALATLQKLPLDQDIKQAFLYVLRHETNPAMRIDVINHLEKPILSGEIVDQDVLGVLKEKMQTDENNYIRIRARNVYEEVKQQ